MPKFEDLKGKRFGRLVVLEQAETRHTRTRWLCKCDCGKTKIIQSNHLKSGASTSCGCYGKEKVSQAVKKHGLSSSNLFFIWSAMKQRCLNPKDKNYKDYGGRGITVCSEWLNPENFYKWAIANAYKKGLSIDRIDVNGNYEPLNCRWATPKEQMRNTRKNHLITYKEQTKCLAEWAEIINIKSQILYKRLKRGWSIEKALETPLMVNKYKFKGV